MHKMAISSSEVEALADQIGDVCDGHHVVVIMAAFAEVFDAIAQAHASKGVTMEDLLTDFVNVARQGYGDGAAH